MEKIESIQAREILDSRGNPTIEVDVVTESGAIGSAAVPSGASTGINEALELRDGNKDRYNGAGTLQAVDNVNNIIAKHIIGMNVRDQVAIDNAMINLDGTPNKSSLGANAMLGVSLAVAHAAADYYDMPLFQYIGGINAKVLPIPMMNIINGGSHSDSPIAFQEFMIRPYGAKSIREAVRMGSEIFHALKKLIKERGLSSAVGDEGGFAPKLDGTEDALNLIMSAIKKAGYIAGREDEGGEVSIALDCAASEFYKNGVYDYSLFEGSNGVKRNSMQQIDFLESLTESYPIESIEDGMSEIDWDGWRELTERIGSRVQLVGDDLFVTNVRFLNRGIIEKCGNAILVKVNQIGTLTETLDTIEMAHKAGYRTIISHRSGETEDTTIADIAVAVNAGQIKTGSMSRSDRVAKYNRLMKIEDILGSQSQYGLSNIK